MNIQKLRDMNLHAVADELEQLRAFKAEVESQKPIFYSVHRKEHEPSNAVCFNDIEAANKYVSNNYDLCVSALYAKPVPADKPKYKAVTASDLPMESSREHLLSEAANRADHFFRQIDGSYSFPAPDGQVAQIIEMLLAAANMPDDKQAVAVPENVLDQGEHTNIPDSSGLISGFRWRMKGGDLWNYQFGRAPDSWQLREADIEYVTVSKAMLSASPAPSHSQQSAVPEANNIIEVKRVSDQSVQITFSSCRTASVFERFILAASPDRCPSHESEQ